MKYIESFISFFKNPDFSIAEKTIWIFSVSMLLITIDVSFSISHYVFYSNKVEHLEEINILKEKFPQNIELINELNRIEKKTINKRTPYENTHSFLRFLFKNKSNSSKISHTNTATNNNIDYIHFLTSAFIWLLGIILVPFGLLMSRKINFETIMSSIMAIVILGSIALLYILILGLIPIIFDNKLFNYLINVFIQGITIFLLIKKSNKK